MVNADTGVVAQKMAYDGYNGNAVLHINVPSSHALQLQHMEPMILEKIASYIGRNNVKRIVLHQI